MLVSQVVLCMLRRLKGTQALPLAPWFKRTMSAPSPPALQDCDIPTACAAGGTEQAALGTHL